MLPILSVCFAVLAGLIWLVFLRPVPTHSALGGVTKKTYKPAGEYTQVHGGTRDAFHLPTTISIAEGYVLDIDLDDDRGSLSSLVNAVQATRYEVGTRVKVDYQLRSVPLLWKKCYVLSVKRADESS